MNPGAAGGQDGVVEGGGQSDRDTNLIIPKFFAHRGTPPEMAVADTFQRSHCLTKCKWRTVGQSAHGKMSDNQHPAQSSVMVPRADTRQRGPRVTGARARGRYRSA